ncbi:MAG: hypothetical protein JWM82_3720, partial [Myxococcales bacterium]|nr:hypothetical protein [Myxococcales bacterium]
MRHLVKRLAWVALSVAGLGCGAGSQGARLDVTVTIDPALRLDGVELAASGGGRAPLQRTFVVAAPTGTPPVVAPVRMEIAISDVPRSFVATIEARGRRKDAGAAVAATIVTAAIDVTVTAGGTIAATL